MNIVRVLEACEQRAAFQYGWNDFAPVGLIFDRTGDVEAIAGYPLGTNLEQVGAMIVRSARRRRDSVAALGVVCSAWASSVAVQEGLNPSVAPDRVRTRLVAAVDRSYLTHLLFNSGGSVSYTTDPAPMGGAGPVLTGAMHRVLAADDAHRPRKIRLP